MLKDRFLHRSSVETEEQFSDDEDENEEENDSQGDQDDEEQREERLQERLPKRFEKRARMQRLIDSRGHEEEFSQSRLVDDEEWISTLKMKNGLARKRSQSSVSSSVSNSSNAFASDSSKKTKD